MLVQNNKSKDKYKYWDVYDELPSGWRLEKFCGSPLHKAVFINNGVAPINGGKHALLRLRFDSFGNVLNLPEVSSHLKNK